jgi:hypothetical protein
MKLCVNCEKYEGSFVGATYSKCSHTLDPVDGSAYGFASLERQQLGHCGPDGRNFIQRKTIWMALKSFVK